MKNLQTIEEKRNYISSSEFQERIKKILNNKEYALAADDDPLNPWQRYEDRLKPKISRYEAMGMQLLSLIISDKAFDQEFPPYPEIKQFMQEFLLHSVGNLKLNDFLRQDLLNNINYGPYLTERSSISRMAYFSYKTRNLENFEEIISKLSRAHQASLQGLPIKEEDKLTTKEFAIASELAKTNSFLRSCKNAGIIEGNEHLNKLYTASNLAKEAMQYIDELTSNELASLNAGTIVLDKTFDKSEIFTMALTFFQKLMAIFCKFGHASMLYVDEDNKPYRSHINPRLEQNAIEGTKESSFNLYQIDVTKLIPEYQQELLANVYGKNWKKEITTKFHIIEKDLHSKIYEHFGNIAAVEESNRIISGLSDFIPFGHKQLKSNDFKAIHQLVMSQHYSQQTDPKMLCSEFIATTIISSLIELDKQIKIDIPDKLGKPAMNKLGINLKNDIVVIPFDKHENLNLIHPDRLLSILQESDCVEEVRMKAADQFIQPKTKVEALKIQAANNHSLIPNMRG